MVKTENSGFPCRDKIYSMCVKENKMLGHPSESLGVLLWHKGVHKPLLSPLPTLTLGTGFTVFYYLTLRAIKVIADASAC